jgi:hypothetical protein
VVPVVLVAVTILFALKTLGLVLDGSYTLGDPPVSAVTNPTSPARSTPRAQRDALRRRPPARAAVPAQQMFNYPR